MDALAEIHNEKGHLHDADLLRVSSILVACSLIAHPAAPVPSATALLALSAARGVSNGLHCDHCCRDGHVDVFCYRRKKVQPCRSS
jgi:hypothetical protein